VVAQENLYVFWGIAPRCDGELRASKLNAILTELIARADSGCDSFTIDSDESDAALDDVRLRRE